jgi:hypothetical protein
MKIASFALLTFSLLLLFFSLISDPYTSWGIEQEHIRPNVARISLRFGIASLVLSLLAGCLSFLRIKESGRAFAIFLFLVSILISTASLARVAWVYTVIS